MNRTIGPARLGFAAALLALLLGPLALGFHSAHAQGPDTASYYGTDRNAGDIVAASIDGTECDSTTADADGQWLVRVGQGACSPEDGDTVSFSVNGDAAEQTVEWSAGGFAEVSLTVAAMPETPDDEDDGDMPAMPEEPDTGNAGLVGSASSSPLAALALAFLAVAGLAGARVATRRVS